MAIKQIKTFVINLDKIDQVVSSSDLQRFKHTDRRPDRHFVNTTFLFGGTQNERFPKNSKYNYRTIIQQNFNLTNILDCHVEQLSVVTIRKDTTICNTANLALLRVCRLSPCCVLYYISFITRTQTKAKFSISLRIEDSVIFPLRVCKHSRQSL